MPATRFDPARPRRSFSEGGFAWFAYFAVKNIRHFPGPRCVPANLKGWRSFSPVVARGTSATLGNRIQNHPPTRNGLHQPLEPSCKIPFVSAILSAISSRPFSLRPL